jgi:hypothetical protein
MYLNIRPPCTEVDPPSISSVLMKKPIENKFNILHNFRGIPPPSHFSDNEFGKHSHLIFR